MYVFHKLVSQKFVFYNSVSQKSTLTFYTLRIRFTRVEIFCGRWYQRVIRVSWRVWFCSCLFFLFLFHFWLFFLIDFLSFLRRFVSYTSSTKLDHWLYGLCDFRVCEVSSSWLWVWTDKKTIFFKNKFLECSRKSECSKKVRNSYWRKTSWKLAGNSKSAQKNLGILT